MQKTHKEDMANEQQGKLRAQQGIATKRHQRFHAFILFSNEGFVEAFKLVGKAESRQSKLGNCRSKSQSSK